MPNAARIRRFLACWTVAHNKGMLRYDLLLFTTTVGKRSELEREFARVLVHESSAVHVRVSLYTRFGFRY